jgi:hypothetical protein
MPRGGARGRVAAAAGWSRALPGAALAALLAALPAALAPGAARAEARTNLPADRTLMPVGVDATFAAEGGETVAVQEVAFGLRYGVFGRPWELRNGLTGATVAVPVRRAQVVEVVAAFGAAPGLEVGLAYPVTVYQTGDRLRGVADDLPLEPTAGGDLRLHLKARIVAGQVRGGRLVLAFAPFLAVPTGDREQFAGVGGPWGAVRLVSGWRGRYLFVAADFGLRLRSPTALYDARQDTAALLFAVGVSVTLPWRSLGRRLAVVADVDGDSQGPGRPVPVEGRLGLSLHLWRGLSVAAAGGLSLSREPGAPPWRALVELRLQPSP